MTAYRTINATLLGEVLAYVECYAMELDHWYSMAKNGDGGSVNHASSTVYHDFEGEFDKSLKEFREEISELKGTIKAAKAILSPKSLRRSALVYWEQMFREGSLEDEQSEYLIEVLHNARKELDDET